MLAIMESPQSCLDTARLSGEITLSYVLKFNVAKAVGRAQSGWAASVCASSECAGRF